MGNEQASEQEMYAALKTAQALEFVEEKREAECSCQ